MSDNRELILIILWMAIFVLVAMCGALLSINIWGIELAGSPLDYRRFGTWTQAIAGATTFFGVMIALASLLWQQAKARRENAEKLLEEQTAVFIWLSSQLLFDESTNNAVGRHWDLEVHNLTRAPIYRWRVALPDSTDNLSNATKRPLLPDKNIFNLPSFDDREPHSIPEPSIYFESRDGAVWKRTATGALSRTSVEQLNAKDP